ncbi:hypothetical protein HAX54_016068, partial [Datura stramonium]|nr:hypothetical protein [Datura stramonium]
ARGMTERQKSMRPADFQSGSWGGSKPRYQGVPFGDPTLVASGREPSHGTPLEIGQ